MKGNAWMTPGEHRLALLLLGLALLGAAVKGLEHLDPRVEAWLAEPLPSAASDAAPDSALPPPIPTVVNPNLASPEDLDTLPGIGPALAKRIVKHRPYGTLQDLLRVPGIGPATLQKMEPRLVLSDSAEVGQTPQPR